MNVNKKYKTFCRKNLKFVQRASLKKLENKWAECFMIFVSTFKTNTTLTVCKFVTQKCADIVKEQYFCY